MTCPRCSQHVELTPDQAAAVGASLASGLVLAAPYFATIIAAPYLAPFLVAGLVWSATRKVACPGCGHRFTLFQEGKQ